VLRFTRVWTGSELHRQMGGNYDVHQPQIDALRDILEHQAYFGDWRVHRAESADRSFLALISFSCSLPPIGRHGSSRSNICIGMSNSR
jgi:hypothetical protein